jgi:hypothetical protein
MATRPVLITKPARGTTKASWTALVTTDDGAPAALAQFNDKSVQVLGTFGGGTVLIEGSNDGGTTWATLNEAGAGGALSFTAAGLKTILEHTALIRPRCSVSVTTIEVHVIGHGDR